jgi:hypothetical protein
MPQKLSCSLLVVAVVLSAPLAAQVYDWTMMPGYQGQVGYQSTFNESFGARNFIPNGNLGRYAASGLCSGSPWGSNWNAAIGQFTGITQGSSIPWRLFPREQNWPYNFRFYCDFAENNGMESGFYAGYLQAALTASTNGVRTYNYLLFQLKHALPVGVEFAFSMNVVKQFGTPATNPAVDRIGAVLLNELPEVITPNMFLADMTPFVETAAGTPVPVTSQTVTTTLTGNGERYLVVGLFHPDDELTFDPVPTGPTWSSTYQFDNFQLHRPGCNGPTSGMINSVYLGCVGEEITIASQYGAEPNEWTVDGVPLTSDTTFVVQAPAEGALIIRQVTGEGACSDTAFAVVRAHRVEVALVDTFLFCDDPMTLAPSVQYLDVSADQVTTTWSSLDGSFTQATGSTIGITLSDPDTYEMRLAYLGCEQRDTVSIAPPPPLLTNAGVPYLLPEVRPEHCINMNDGAIIVHDLGYPEALTYEWYAPALPAASDSLLGLGEGIYRARVRDAGLRCAFWDLEVPLLLDGCARAEGQVVNSLDFACTTPADDLPMPYQSVMALPSTNAGVSDLAGRYSIYVPPGSSTLHHDPQDVWTGNRCGDGTTITLPAAGSEAVVDMIDTVRIPVHDLAITSALSSTWVIGTAGYLTVNVYNQGDLPMGVTLRVHLGSPEVVLETAGEPEFEGQSGDTLLFDLGDLSPGGSVQRTYSFSIPVNTDLIGESPGYHLAVEPGPTETDLADNSWAGSPTILGAYDPNDKQVSPAGERFTDLTDPAERRFTYTVRFQNTGNYPATRVLITDTLHPLLNAGSLQLLTATHGVEAFVYNRVLYLDHQGIMLPDSASDPEGSQGQVTFQFDAVPEATIGDAILNTANIFFDQNPPIITNTVRNLYGINSTTGVLEQVSTVQLLVRSDGAGGLFYTVDLAGSVPQRVVVQDVRGAVVVELGARTSGHLPAGTLASGVYVLAASNADHRVQRRFVMAK